MASCTSTLSSACCCCMLCGRSCHLTPQPGHFQPCMLRCGFSNGLALGVPSPEHEVGWPTAGAIPHAASV